MWFMIFSDWGGGGAVKYKTVSMRDHNFSKHLPKEDFFHAKMTH